MPLIFQPIRGRLTTELIERWTFFSVCYFLSFLFWILFWYGKKWRVSKWKIRVQSHLMKCTLLKLLFFVPISSKQIDHLHNKKDPRQLEHSTTQYGSQNIYEIVFDLLAVSRRYHTCDIISRGLYIFYPIFEDHFLFSENSVLIHCYYQEKYMTAPAFSAVGPILLGRQLEQKSSKSMCSHVIFVIYFKF